MESMRDGEIYWVIGNGMAQHMPAFGTQFDETQRWELVQYVRRLRLHRRRWRGKSSGPTSGICRLVFHCPRCRRITP